MPNTNSTGAKTIIDHRKIDNTKVRKRWQDMSGDLGGSQPMDICYARKDSC